MRSRLYIRIARAATAGGGDWGEAGRGSAGIAAKLSLAAIIDARTRFSRATGSASLVARSASNADTRFRYASSSLPLRTLIGTIAINDSSGRQSWRIR